MEHSENIKEIYTTQLLPRALITFQYIEEELKVLIKLFHEIIKECTKDKINYSYKEGSIKDAPLGTLIVWFRSYCDDQDLLKDLNQTKNDRNHIAHRAYFEILNGDRGESELIEELNKAVEIEGKASNILRRLQSLRQQIESKRVSN